MTKTAAKREAEPKTNDAEQFQRFLEAARKRSMNESLEDFAAKFGKNTAKAEAKVGLKDQRPPNGAPHKRPSRARAADCGSPILPLGALSISRNFRDKRGSCPYPAGRSHFPAAPRAPSMGSDAAKTLLGIAPRAQLAATNIRQGPAIVLSPCLRHWIAHLVQCISQLGHGILLLYSSWPAMPLGAVVGLVGHCCVSPSVRFDPLPSASSAAISQSFASSRYC